MSNSNPYPNPDPNVLIVTINRSLNDRKAYPKDISHLIHQPHPQPRPQPQRDLI